MNKEEVLSMSVMELEQLLRGYTKAEINNIRNMLTGTIEKLTGTKEDYIDKVINIKKAITRGRAFENGKGGY